MPDKKRVIALGFFDGVHAGHAALMEMTKRRAAERDAIPTVITFDTHPDTLVKGVEVPLINSPAERAEIIRRIYGIDSVVFIHFSEKTMHMPWREFIDSVTEEMRACHYVVGYDFSFGWKGEGRPARLAAYCTEHGLGCDIISAVRIDGEVVSSTRIRALLTEGRIEEANRLLGHPHSLVDTVRSGFRLGHKLGSPTINMGFAPGVLVPRHGVYAAKVFLDDGTEGYHHLYGTVGDGIDADSPVYIAYNGTYYEALIASEDFSATLPGSGGGEYGVYWYSDGILTRAGLSI